MAAIPPNTSVTSTTPGSIGQQAQAIKEAASSAGIPTWVLLGVYGAESSFGTAYPAGDKNTAGYFGLTSAGLWNASDTFAQDAQTSANLLAKLFKEHGSWDAALQAYSGGSYGEAHVMSLSTSAPAALKQAVGNLAVNGPVVQAGKSVVGAVSGAVNTVTSAASATESIASLITSGSFWLRVLEGIGGVVLLVLGLRALSGGDGNPITVTTNAAKKAGSAAAVAAA